MVEKTNKFLLCFNVLFVLSISLWKCQYSNETATIGHSLDARTSRLLGEEADVQTSSKHRSLQKKIAEFINENVYKFSNALNESIDDDTFPSKYNSLNHNSSFEEKNNTPNSYDNLDKSNNISKNAQSSDSIDYIGDCVNEDNCNDEQQLYTLEQDNHDEKQVDTLMKSMKQK
ncbi:Pv-fam-d protein [Plasmodium ovale wallikeri]|uniref:Pv-fam-d protein n=1 Tax=Plasmodium ovale wallikeri TaxID=864142 RepID=A0A1A9APN2_PLAOA|nr:Pv-fam-d protein [Plasmodium ovale wallikeri]SBT58175.1 Pv-fam-d protein [Plasmodium ovale wallikeri]